MYEEYATRLTTFFKGLINFQNFTSLPAVSVPPWGDNIQPQILRRWRSENNECLEVLKEFLLQTDICLGAYYLSCQKRLCKVKYGSD